MQHMLYVSACSSFDHLFWGPPNYPPVQTYVNTYETNTIGTLNLLESLRNLNKKCIAIFITSDKCYENNEWIWGYREIDKLGGNDPYSSSKAIVANGPVDHELRRFAPSE